MIRAEPLASEPAWPYGRSMDGYLVESYWPGVSGEEVRHACHRVAASDSPATTFLGAALVPGDETVFFQFTAVSGAAVSAACASAGVRCDRLVPADFWPPSAAFGYEGGQLRPAADT